MGRVMMGYLKLHPNNIGWNEKEEMIYLGRVIPGAKMSDLMAVLLKNCKKDHATSLHTSCFLKALADIEVPILLILTTPYLKEIQYSQEIDWLSSTASRR